MIRVMDLPMKRKIAWFLAVGSGLYLLVVGPLPDPLPILDEATALLVFVKSMSYLGYDVRRWVPFLGSAKGSRKSKSRDGRDPIDV